MNEKTSEVMNKQLMINPHVKIIHSSDSEILIKHGSRSRFSQVIKDEGRTKLLGKILRRLQEPKSLNHLTMESVITSDELHDAENLIVYLLEQQVLIEEESYLPHIYLSMQFGKQAGSIASRIVGIVGSGYIGSRIARELARVSVKEILVLDDRQYQTSDQSYFDIPQNLLDVGKTYADLVKEDLDLQGYSNVQTITESIDNQKALNELFEKVDFVVVGLEFFSPRVFHAVNEVANDYQKPWITAYVDGSEAFIGPIYIPGETCCYNEYEIQHEALIGLKEDYLIYKESMLEEDLHTPHLVLPPYASLINGWTMTAILPFLTTAQSFAVGRSIRIDLERVSVDYEEILKLPRCPACGPKRPGYRHMYL